MKTFLFVGDFQEGYDTHLRIYLIRAVDEFGARLVALREVFDEHNPEAIETVCRDWGKAGEMYDGSFDLVEVNLASSRDCITLFDKGKPK